MPLGGPCERRRSTHQLFVGLLRQGKKSGDVRLDVDERATADAILAFMTGAQLQYFLDPKRVDLVAVYERFTAMLLRDVARGRGAVRSPSRGGPVKRT